MVCKRISVAARLGHSTEHSLDAAVSAAPSRWEVQGMVLLLPPRRQVGWRGKVSALEGEMGRCRAAGLRPAAIPKCDTSPAEGILSRVCCLEQFCEAGVLPEEAEPGNTGFSPLRPLPTLLCCGLYFNTPGQWNSGPFVTPYQ